MVSFCSKTQIRCTHVMHHVCIDINMAGTCVLGVLDAWPSCSFRHASDTCGHFRLYSPWTSRRPGLPCLTPANQCLTSIVHVQAFLAFQRLLKIVRVQRCGSSRSSCLQQIRHRLLRLQPARRSSLPLCPFRLQSGALGPAPVQLVANVQLVLPKGASTSLRKTHMTY